MFVCLFIFVFVIIVFFVRDIGNECYEISGIVERGGIGWSLGMLLVVGLRRL